MRLFNIEIVGSVGLGYSPALTQR